MDRLKGWKRWLWLYLFGSLGAVLAAGVLIGGVLSDIKASKRHVDEHPARMAQYNAVVQEFRTANVVIKGEIKAATDHRHRQDIFMKDIVKHLARLGVVTDPIVMKETEMKEKWN